jgi:hypothetical protein
MEEKTLHRSNGAWKPVTVIMLMIIAFAMLMKGNELGQFYYHGPYYWRVFWGIYLFSLVILSPLIFKIVAPEIFSDSSWKERARTLLVLVFTSFMFAFILNGLAYYIDYFFGKKKWQNITAVVADIPDSYRRKSSTTYTYKMTTDKDTILLKSTLTYHIGDTLKLKITTTPLGNIVAETRR